jgi:tellurite methyltransferase
VSSNEDAQRWNTRYLEERYRSFERPRPFLIDQLEHLPERGLALDVAMGLGGNAGLLLERGLQVVGVDVSEVAVRHAREAHPGLMALVADLTRFEIPSGAFDLILNFFYLQRDLWPQYRRGLRPGGLLVFESLTTAMLELTPDIDPEYLLEPGELRRAFEGEGMQVLAYREGWREGDEGHRRATAALLARRL